MRRNQQGITLVGFVMVLAVVGVLLYMGMKVVPMYAEYFAVKKALDGMAAEPGMADNDPEKIKDLFFRRLYTSYSENVKPENVKLVRKDAGWVMTVNYEVRRPLIADLDIVGHYGAQKEFKRHAD